MKKLRNDCKGSTLVILLLTIAILFLIGTAILSFSVTNYKMKKLNSEVKKAFYLADAGIDEAYIITREFLKSAVDYSNHVLEKNIELEQQNNEKLKNTQNNSSGSINSIEIMKLPDDEINSIFKNAFINFIKGTHQGDGANSSLISILNSNTSYLICRDGYPKIEAKLTENISSFILELKSTYIKGNIVQTIKMKCIIDIPEYEYYSSDEYTGVDSLIKTEDWAIER